MVPKSLEGGRTDALACPAADGKERPGLVRVPCPECPPSGRAQKTATGSQNQIWGRRTAAPINPLSARTESPLKASLTHRAPAPSASARCCTPSRPIRAALEAEQKPETAQPAEGTLVPTLRALLSEACPNYACVWRRGAHCGSPPEKKESFWVGACPVPPAAWEGADAGTPRRRLS